MTIYKPLSYPNKKCVLQFMDPNVRLHLIQKCPRIRNVEKMLPLKIKSLQLGTFTVRINDTMYRLGAIRQYYNEKETPDYIRKENIRGGVQYEQDRFLSQASDMSLTPGDILIGKLENMTVYPYRFKHPLRYTQCIQLTIKSPRRSEVEMLKYSGKLSTTMKYFMEKLFGRRREDIQVTTLKIHVFEHYDCFRLPVNLKLATIKELKITRMAKEVLEAFKPILDPSSFPLKILEIDTLTRSDHQIIQTAKKLVLSRFSLNEDLAQFHHRRVHFHNRGFHYSDVEIIIANWQLHGREVGTYYSFAVVNKWEVETLWNSAKQQPGAKLEKPTKKIRGQFRHHVILPINDHSEIVICCEKISRWQDYRTIRWIFKMKVQQKGDANRQ